MPNDTAPTRATSPSWLVPDRVLAAQGTRKGGSLTTLELEEVRDYVARVSAAQAAQDHDRSFSQLHVSFTGGRVQARFLDRNNGLADEMLVHENAYQQMAGNLLPGRGGSFLMAQARLGEQGEKLSTMSWATFAKHDTTARNFRTVATRDPADGSIRRMLRSQHSQGYGAYDNLTFLNDMLEQGEWGGFKVAQFHMTDTAMRLRFVDTDGEIPLRSPVPMVEAWNSEVGRRRVSLVGGAFRLVCTNGMGSWDKKSEFAWRHYGNSERIAGRVRSAIEEIATAGSVVVDAYTKALDVSIDDAMLWMERELGLAGASTTQVANATKALTDATTTPGFGLASVVDAVTLAAQEEGSLFDQAEMEAFGTRLLRRGLSAARNERILVEA